MNLTRNLSWKTKLMALAVGLLAGFGAWHSMGLGARRVSANANGAPATAPVNGATLTVNSPADIDNTNDKPLTLREASPTRNKARAVGAGEAAQVSGTPGGGGDSIVFNLGAGTPTINLTSALPTIASPVSINGNTGGATRVELNGAGAGAGANGLLILEGFS